MKKFQKLICLALLACLVLSCLAGCGGQDGDTTAPSGDANATEPTAPFVDYVAQHKLDMNSDTKQMTFTKDDYIFVDGDTAHFPTDDPLFNGMLKVRFLAIDTPECTGRIEEYGKKAARFTEKALSNAFSIIVESDTADWAADSTGSRFMGWVWYQPEEGADYRLLNLEILQNGLAVASNTANNRYGDICMNALSQAKAHKLNIHSGQKDPNFYDGDIVELTLRELSLNVHAYEGVKVGFSGVVTMNDNNTIYVEQYDAETDMYYGMAVYLGFNLPGTALEIISVGNEAWIVGTVQFYKTGGTWQVSGLSYRAMAPDDPSNLKLISTGNSAAYVPIDPVAFVNDKVTYTMRYDAALFEQYKWTVPSVWAELDKLRNEVYELDENLIPNYSPIILLEPGTQPEANVVEIEIPYAQLLLNTSVLMENLKVVDVYTTTNEESSSKGAMTLTCEVNGVRISVRTAVLKDADGNLITASAFMGKTISVRGVVDFYMDGYQIRVLTMDQITIEN